MDQNHYITISNWISNQKTLLLSLLSPLLLSLSSKKDQENNLSARKRQENSLSSKKKKWIDRPFFFYLQYIALLVLFWPTVSCARPHPQPGQFYSILKSINDWDQSSLASMFAFGCWKNSKKRKKF